MKTLRLLPLVLGVVTCAAIGADKPVHVFILSGQSNMAGMKPAAGFLPEAKKLFADGEVVYIKVARGGAPSASGSRSGTRSRRKTS